MTQEATALDHLSEAELADFLDVLAAYRAKRLERAQNQADLDALTRKIRFGERVLLAAVELRELIAQAVAEYPDLPLAALATLPDTPDTPDSADATAHALQPSEPTPRDKVVDIIRAEALAEAERTVVGARTWADQTVVEARVEAERILEQARRDASDLLASARSDADQEARAILEGARSQAGTASANDHAGALHASPADQVDTTPTRGPGAPVEDEMEAGEPFLSDATPSGPSEAAAEPTGELTLGTTEDDADVADGAILSTLPESLYVEPVDGDDTSGPQLARLQPGQAVEWIYDGETFAPMTFAAGAAALSIEPLALPDVDTGRVVGVTLTLTNGDRESSRAIVVEAYAGQVANAFRPRRDTGFRLEVGQDAVEVYVAAQTRASRVRILSLGLSLVMLRPVAEVLAEAPSVPGVEPISTAATVAPTNQVEVEVSQPESPEAPSAASTDGDDEYEVEI